jgi:hypothetical protein
MGSACLLSLPMIARLGRALYNLNAPNQIDPRFEYGLKPLGAFAISFAALSFRAGWFGKPDEIVFFEIVFIVLLCLRAWFRFLYRDLFEKAFGVSWSRSRWNCCVNVMLATILALSVLTK